MWTARSLAADARSITKLINVCHSLVSMTYEERARKVSVLATGRVGLAKRQASGATGSVLLLLASLSGGRAARTFGEVARAIVQLKILFAELGIYDLDFNATIRSIPCFVGR